MLYNWPMMGHEEQLNLLEKDLRDGNLAHAYLFAGPQGLGKFTIARTLAMILQCPNNFCKKCPTCLQMKQGQHLDTIILSDTGESIKIDQIRELIGSLCLSVQAKYKLILIEGIERMTVDSANSLLKTLEEPNPKTIFLLTTNNVREVLTTIISRVRLIKFQPFTEKTLIEELQKWRPGEDPDRLKVAVSFAMGLPARALKLLEQEELFLNYQRIYESLRKFLQDKSIHKRFLFVEELYQKEDEVEIFLTILIHLLRKELINQLLEQHPNQETAHFIAMIEKADNVKYLLKRNVNARLALENLVLNL